MTVTASPAKDQYYGDGVTAAFNTTFQFQNASEVLVTILSIDGLTETTKTLSSHYDITGGGGATGQVVFRAGNIPAGTGGAGTSEKISITRNMPLSQQLDLTANDPFPAQSVELSLGDRLIMIAQQQQEQINRSAKLKLSSSLASGPLFDDPSDGKVPIYSTSAGAYQNGPTATEVTNAQTYSVQALGYKNDAQAAAAAATAAAAGMKFRSVRAATTANITLSAPQTIDGVSVIAGERVLVKNQSAPAENGIYVVAAGAWTRSTDMDTWTEVTGSVVVIEEGSTLADTAWLCTANQGGTLGTTAINFVDWGQVILGGGIALAKLAVQAANTIVANTSGSSASPTAVAIAANRFLARSSAGNLEAKTITDFALSLLDDADATAARATLGVFNPQIAGGRLTLSTGVPVTQSDVASSSTIYYSPYTDNRLSLYDGFGWWTYTFVEPSIALSGLTASRPYDVFAYSNAGVVTLETAIWNSGTARHASGTYATELPLQDGIPVKSTNGTTIDATRRYLGTFYSTSTTATADTLSTRYLYNEYNQVIKSLYAGISTSSYAYSTATWRAANSNTTNGDGRFSWVNGRIKNRVTVNASRAAYNTLNVAHSNGIALNGVTSSELTGTRGYSELGAIGTIPCYTSTTGVVGHNFIQAMEIGGGSGTTNWYGQSVGGGMIGTLMC